MDQNLIKDPEIAAQKQEGDIFLKQTDCCYDHTILNIFLVLGIVGFTVYTMVWSSNNYYFLIGTGVFALGYIIEVFTSNTFRFIFHSMKYNVALGKIEQLSKTNPIISWSIQCYHYETRTRTIETRNSDGTTSYSTQTYTERVNTHYASLRVPYIGCVDSSNMMECMKHLPLLQYCRIYISKMYGFVDSESRSNFDRMKSGFISSNNFDTHYDFSEGFEIPGYISRICTYGSNDNSLPCAFSMGTFLFTSLIGFGWIIRILLYKRSFAAKTNIIKNIKI
jgi:hypothetical protein